MLADLFDEQAAEDKRAAQSSAPKASDSPDEPYSHHVNSQAQFLREVRQLLDLAESYEQITLCLYRYAGKWSLFQFGAQNFRVVDVAEWDGPAVLPPLTALRVGGA